MALDIIEDIIDRLQGMKKFKKFNWNRNKIE